MGFDQRLHLVDLGDESSDFIFNGIGVRLNRDGGNFGRTAHQIHVTGLRTGQVHRVGAGFRVCLGGVQRVAGAGKHADIISGIGRQSTWDRARAVHRDCLTGAVSVRTLGSDGFAGGIHAADFRGTVAFGGGYREALDSGTVAVDCVAFALQRAGVVDLIKEVFAAG